MHIWFQPCKKAFLNVFEIVTQVVTCLTLQGSILFYTSKESEGWKYDKLVPSVARDVLMTANVAVELIFLRYRVIPLKYVQADCPNVPESKERI